MTDQPNSAAAEGSGVATEARPEIDCFGDARPILIGVFGLWFAILIASALTG